MVSRLYSRVKVVTTTTGTGDYTVGSAIPAYRDFTVVTTGETVSYLAEQGLDYEWGQGLFTAPSTLARTTILGSSNSGNAVDWASPPTISLTPNSWDLQSGSQARNLVRLDDNGKILSPLLPLPTATTLGGVKSAAAQTGKVVTSIGTDGAPVVGDIPAPDVTTRGGVYTFAGQDYTPPYFVTGLLSSGTLQVTQVYFSHILGQISGTQLPGPTPTTVGGIYSKDVVASQFLTGIGTNGVASSAQPSFSDISGTITPAQAAGTGGWILLSTLTASSSASLLNITSFTSAYSEYEIRIMDLIPSANAAALGCNMYVNGAWASAGYSGTTNAIVAQNAIATVYSSTYIDLTAGARVAAGAGVNLNLRLTNPSNSSGKKTLFGSGTYLDYFGYADNLIISAYSPNTSPVTGLQFNFGSGVITSGTIKIYGRN
jgi:hypothetical protein